MVTFYGKRSLVYLSMMTGSIIFRPQWLELLLTLKIYFLTINCVNFVASNYEGVTHGLKTTPRTNHVVFSLPQWYFLILSS